MRLLDETNLRLLNLLLEDARLPVSQLARRLHRSEATVRDRIAALEKNGVLRGYRADVDHEKVGLGITAIVRANVDRRQVPGVRKALLAIPNVVSADLLSGERAVRVRLVAGSIPELHAAIRDRLMTLGLENIDIRVVLSTMVPARAPDLEAFPPPPGRDGARDGARA